MPVPGPFELVIILVIVLLIFGAGKLPQVFGSLGKGIKEFREAAESKDEDGADATTTANPAPPSTLAQQEQQADTTKVG